MTITPSTGILFPGLTTTTSPFTTSSIDLISSLPPFNTIAVEGLKLISFLIASDVFFLELDSKYLPKEIDDTIIKKLLFYYYKNNYTTLFINKNYIDIS